MQGYGGSDTLEMGIREGCLQKPSAEWVWDHPQGTRVTSLCCSHTLKRTQDRRGRRTGRAQDSASAPSA